MVCCDVYNRPHMHTQLMQLSQTSPWSGIDGISSFFGSWLRHRTSHGATPSSKSLKGTSMKGVPLFGASSADYSVSGFTGLRNRSYPKTLLPGLFFFSLDVELKVAISALSPAFISPFLLYHMVNLKDDKPGPSVPLQGLSSSLVL